MSDTLIIILIVVIEIGSLVAMAYFLDQRRKKTEPVGPALPPLGPGGKILLWIARILVGLMVVSIVGAFALRSILLAWLTASCLALYLITGFVFRIVRADGK